MNFVMEDPIINGKVLEDNCFFGDKDCLVELLDTVDDNGVREQGGELFVNTERFFPSVAMFCYEFQLNLRGPA